MTDPRTESGLTMGFGTLDPFLTACGAEGPLIVDASRGGAQAQTETRALGQPYAIVGRLPRADVSLKGAEVSRRHLYVQLLEGRLYAVDLGSRDGTVVGGQTLGAGWIGAGQDVAIGPFALRFRPAGKEGGAGVEEVAPEALDPRSAEFGDSRPELPPVSLDVSDSTGRRWAWRMRGGLALVGHGPLCRVGLRGQGISQYHCSLVRTPHGLWVVDLLTEWGTALNGAPIRAGRLAPGDRLTVGPFTMRLRERRSELPARVPQPQPSAPRPASLITTAEWLATDPASALSPDTALVPGEVVDRLQALERRQEAMQGQFQQAMLMMLQAFGGMHREQMDILTTELAEVRRLSEAIDGLRAELGRKTADRPPIRADSSQVVREDLPGFDADAAGRDEPRPRPSPREVHAYVSERLAAFERERQSRWNRILSTLTGVS